MARRKDIGDELVEKIIHFYWEYEPDEFEEWLDNTFSRHLAKIITGKERTEIDEKTFDCDQCGGTGVENPDPLNTWPCRKCKGKGRIKTNKTLFENRNKSVWW